MNTTVAHITLVAAVILPLFNIPLIVRIISRRSSADISIIWAIGVWVCTLLMAPAGLVSKDIVWRSYTIINSILFTGVFVVVLIYWKWR